DLLSHRRERLEARASVLEALTADGDLVRDALEDAPKHRAHRRDSRVARLERRRGCGVGWRQPHPPALRHLITKFGDPREGARRQPAFGELLDAPGEALLQVVLVPRARRLAVELAPLLGELADAHRLERGELGGAAAELARVRAGPSNGLGRHLVRASFCAFAVLAGRRRGRGRARGPGPRSWSSSCWCLLLRERRARGSST